MIRASKNSCYILPASYTNGLFYFVYIDPEMSEDLKELAESVKSSSELLDCKFVEPFPKEVQTDCSVCLQTLKQPYMVGCCGYHFCKSCLAPSVYSCPLCKEIFFDKLQDKQLECLLDQRPVYCLLQDSGCKWIGELGKLSSHLSFEDSLSVTACEKLPVPCSHCGGYFKRADLPGHQGVCESRPSQCIYCSYKCLFKELASHHKICPKIPRSCKNNCGVYLTPDKLESHLKNNCPLELISCEYHFTGCEDKFCRKDFQMHMEENLSSHLNLTTVKLKQTLSSLELLKSENEKFQKEKLELQVQSEKLACENKALQQKAYQPILQLKVTNLPPGVTKHNLHCVFGMFGSVTNIQLSQSYFAFEEFALIEYSSPNDSYKALQASSAKEINLLKRRLSIEPVYSP